ncbi:17103_t:CDS:2, partial [Funneliformis geosporum]
MSDTLNMVIDDFRKPRGRTHRSSRRGGRVSTSHVRGTLTRNARLRNAPYERQRPPRGDINGQWSHDLFEESSSNNRRSIATSSRRIISNPNGNNKLVVENLFYEVTQEDLEELFSECGTVKKVHIHYDRAGRSTGVADVVFEEPSEAEAALRKYDGKTLDVMDRLGGAPIKSARGNIRERLGNAAPPAPASRGRGRGRGRTNNSSQKSSNRKPVTYDDLDADLDAYMAIDDGSSAAEKKGKRTSRDQDVKYDICQVSILNLQNEATYCDQRFLYNGSTGNMANHLHGKHNIHEKMNKLQDKSVQLTLPQILERFKIKPHKESRNKKIRQAITEWIVVDNLPINVIQGKCYRKMMTIIDPVFLIPSNKRIKKKIHIGYTNSIEELKMLL